MSKPRKPTGDYAVGYGKPPVSGQFKSGQSGNPKGRPKGSQAFATILKTALEEMLPVTVNGRTRRRSKKEIMTTVLVNKAVRGDLRAWMELVKLSREAGLENSAPEADVVPLDPGHVAIIERALRARLASDDEDEGDGGATSGAAA